MLHCCTATGEGAEESRAERLVKCVDIAFAQEKEKDELQKGEFLRASKP